MPSLKQGLSLNNGKYICQNLVERGERSETWLCVSRSRYSSELRVVIKAVDQAANQNGMGGWGPENEIRSLKRVRSDYTVKLIDDFLEFGTRYIVLSCFNGRRLDRVVKNDHETTPLEKSVAAKYVIEASVGVTDLHVQEIYHRNIQPSNIMLHDEKARIIGFGSSCSFSAGEGRSPISNLSYVAPELLPTGSKFSVFAEQYSLGCVLYFLLTGRHPVRRNGGDDKRFHQDVGRSGIASDLKQIITRSTDEDPYQRYDSIASFSAALQPYCINQSSREPAPEYLFTHWLSKIIDVTRSESLMTDEEWLDLLEVHPVVFSRIRLGFYDDAAPIQKASSVVRKLIPDLNESDIWQVLTCSPENTKLVDDLLIKSKKKLASELRLRLKRERNIVEVTHIPNGMFGLNTQTGDPFENQITQARINRVIAMLIPDLVDRSLIAFETSSGIKQLAINQDPEAEVEKGHVRFSNMQVASLACEELLKDASRQNSVFKTLKIAEGGVGGAHTSYHVIKEITKGKGRERFHNHDVLYRGFELVPRYAWMANEFISGHLNTSDSRTQLFGGLVKRKKLLPFASCRFVENCDMSQGFDDLFNSTSFSGHLNSLDIVIISYALHHVPNGSAIRDFLRQAEGGSGTSRLSECYPEVKVLFYNGLTKVLNSCVGGVGTRVKPNPLPSNVFLPVRTLWENLDWVTLGHKENFKSFLEFINGEFKKNLWFSNYWISKIRNRRRELLCQIYGLLRPDGLLLIADPDGTGPFNWARWKEDAEATIANFITRRELEIELEQCGFPEIKGFDVIESGSGYELTSDHRERVIASDAKDHGYVVVAKKK